MRTKFLLSAAAVLIGTAPILGHHAFGGEFDPNKPVLLKGPVTKVEWVNPHAWIHLEVTKPDGTKEEWMVEGGTPNTLLTGVKNPVAVLVTADGALLVADWATGTVYRISPTSQPALTTS